MLLARQSLTFTVQLLKHSSIGSLSSIRNQQNIHTLNNRKSDLFQQGRNLFWLPNETRFNHNIMGQQRVQQRLQYRYNFSTESKNQKESKKSSFDWKKLAKNPKEALIICIIFALAGSTTMYVVRPIFNMIGFKGSLKEGPWSYRIGYILMMTPAYSAILFTYATLFGRRQLFLPIILRMWAPIFKLFGRR
mmetsp:Transcript_19144/g.28488  ORF Transcript_19144/g.28488 Transcript_19144/m.28488 type:complete len:191 (+) Transcript_19144:155-727(+)